MVDEGYSGGVLRISAELEVPVSPDQAKSKRDETKTALRELGLKEDVS